MAKRELVLIAGVEGGGTTLYGEKTETGWRFQRSYVDQTPWMIDEPEIRRDSAWVDTWQEALISLDGVGWYRLPGVMIHPEFRERVWEAVQERINRDPRIEPLRRQQLLARWRERCDIDPD